MFYICLGPYVILTIISQLFHVSECIPYGYREWKEGEIQLSQYTYTTGIPWSPRFLIFEKKPRNNENEDRKH